MAKKDITINKIKDAFWELYEYNRIEKITVKEICQKANINRSTFYVYFTDTYQVLDTIENSIFPPNSMLPQFNSNSKQTTFDIKTHWALLQGQKKYLKVLLSSNGDPAFRFKFIEYIRPMVIGIISEKHLSIDSTYLLEFTLHGVLGAFEHYINNDIDNNDDYTLQTIINIIEKIYY